MKVHFSFHLACESGCHFCVKQAQGARSQPICPIWYENEIWVGNMTGAEKKVFSDLVMWSYCMWRHFQGYKEVHFQN